MNKGDSMAGRFSMSIEPKLIIKPINTKLTKLLLEFFRSEQSSGIVLILYALTAILVANSRFGKDSLDFWHYKIGFKIALSSFPAIKAGISKLPGDLLWKHIIGAGFLGGIGFTMSIFITLLAFGDSQIIQSTKISILPSSLFAGGTGFLILNRLVSGSS
jgi:NhaA family Na+:H+ antiporter